MFLEINNKKHMHALILATFFLLNCSLILAQDLKDKPIYVSKPTYIKSEETKLNQSDKTLEVKKFLTYFHFFLFFLSIHLNLFELNLPFLFHLIYLEP